MGGGWDREKSFKQQPRTAIAILSFFFFLALRGGPATPGRTLTVALKPPPAKMGWSGYPLWPKSDGQSPLILFFIFSILNNIFLLFFVSGTCVPFMVLEFMRRNSRHQSILD